MDTQASTKQMKAQPNKKAESTVNTCAMKYRLKIKIFFTTGQFPAISSLLVASSGVGFPLTARVTFLEELGTMPKNNLRGITLLP